MKVWIGGHGSIEHMTIARNEAEAMNNILEIDPIFAAIGVTVRQLGPVDGCEIIAQVPEDYVYGDDRRNSIDKAERKATEPPKGKSKPVVEEPVTETDDLIG